jgi:hypothetical protein
MRALRCMACGKFMSTVNMYGATGNVVCHLKEKCFLVLLKRVKKNCSSVAFYSPADTAQIMSEIFDFGNRED